MSWLSSLIGVHIPIAKPLAGLVTAGATAVGGPAAGVAVGAVANKLATGSTGPAVQQVPVTSATQLAGLQTAAPGMQTEGAPAAKSGLPSWVLPAGAAAAGVGLLALLLRRR